MTLKRVLAWPLLRLQMMRVSRGFTVHSPFAYHFIIRCLRERLPYYAFRHEVTSESGQRLFRVAAYFNPRFIRYIGEHQEAERIVSLACPRAVETAAADELPDFTYVAAGSTLPDDFRVLYAEDCSLQPPAAMTFTNGRVMIAVRRKGLPAQSFRLSF